MSRAAETYRGARRNAVRGALWAMTKIGHIGVRPYPWPSPALATGRAELMAMNAGYRALGYHPHQADRERARRLRQITSARATSSTPLV
jgi:hypothetical protein